MENEKKKPGATKLMLVLSSGKFAEIEKSN